jgi:GLPGLI family protein
MKAIFFAPILLAAAPSLAQQTSGTIVYEQVVTIDMEGAELPEGIAAMMPKEHKSEKVLYFSPEATLYENSAKSNEGQKENYSQDNIQIHIERNEPDEKTYTDIANKKVVEQKDLMGRLFLVSRNTEAGKWKFTGRQKKILDLPCMEATSISEDDSITAWYTTGIPVQAGPAHISGLPGMVLEANIGKGLHLVAKRVDYNTDVAQKIKQPAKGKKITAEEFDRLAKEKQEEMQKQFGGRGNVQIIRQVR